MLTVRASSAKEDQTEAGNHPKVKKLQEGQ
jgi:hypothetical protein